MRLLDCELPRAGTVVSGVFMQRSESGFAAQARVLLIIRADSKARDRVRLYIFFPVKGERAQVKANAIVTARADPTAMSAVASIRPLTEMAILKTIACMR